MHNIRERERGQTSHTNAESRPIWKHSGLG